MKPPACLTLVLLTAAATSQIPDGHVVVASMHEPGQTNYPGLGGLLFAHPRTPGPFETIANVPGDLIVTPGQRSGARSILILPDRELLVGAVQPQGVLVAIHRLRLLGAAVANGSSIPLGTAFSNNGGGVAQMVLGAPTHALAVGNFVSSLPTIGSGMFVIHIDLATQTVANALPGWTYPAPGPNPLVQGVAFDAARQTAYVLFRYGASSGPYTSEVWSFVPGPAPAPVLVCSMPGSGLNLACSRDGHVYIALDGGGANPVLYRYTPGTGVTALLTGWAFVQTVTVEPTTGHLLLCGMQNRLIPATGGLHWFDITTNTPTQLANVLRNGQQRGPLMGVAAAPDPATYGATSGPAPAYPWSDRPDPTRLSIRGNSAFSVAVDWPAGSTPIAAACALGSQLLAPIPYPPIELNVWPVLVVPMVFQGTRSVLPLPLPIDLTPNGEVALQAFHLLGPPYTLHASEGLRITIL